MIIHVVKQGVHSKPAPHFLHGKALRYLCLLCCHAFLYGIFCYGLGQAADALIGNIRSDCLEEKMLLQLCVVKQNFDGVQLPLLLRISRC